MSTLVLFKYLPIDASIVDSSSIQYQILKSLLEGKVKFSLLSSLNDPTEALFRFESQDDGNFRQHVINEVQRSAEISMDAKTIVHLWTTENRPIYSDIIQFLRLLKIPNQVILDIERRFDLEQPALKYRSVRDNYGVFCLSERNDSALMWSHYCNKHTGICVEFGVPEGLNNLHKVIYSTGRNIPLNGSTEFNEARVELELKNAITTKYIDWKYEQEWRQIKLNTLTEYQQLENSSGFIADTEMRVTGIIFGLNTDTSVKEAIRNLAGDKINYLNCQLDYGTYDIVPLG